MTRHNSIHRARYDGREYIRNSRRVLVVLDDAQHVRISQPRTTAELHQINRILDREGWPLTLLETENGTEVFDGLYSTPLTDREWLEV